jgi:hypothetical protein
VARLYVGTFFHLFDEPTQSDLQVVLRLGSLMKHEVGVNALHAVKVQLP